MPYPPRSHAMTNRENLGSVCLTCRFFDDHESKCKRFPPQVRVESVYEDGDSHVFWEQPTIDIEWSTACGEWQPDVADETPYQRMLRVGKRINEWKADGKLKD
jgi:hypothetical protein